MSAKPAEIGLLLRRWRHQRRLSQLALAVDADVSQRHLSFLESGRARPSRDMILHLCARLEVPLRERNQMLIAAGFAPHYPQRDPRQSEFQEALAMIDTILHGYLPHPALAVDRHWNLISANSAVRLMMEKVDPFLLQGKVNVLRLGLHPQGLAPRILNLPQWRAHLLRRLARDIDMTADAVLMSLRDELEAYPVPITTRASQPPRRDGGDIAIPLELASPAGVLSFWGTTTIFSTAVDVTLSEIVIEAFLPANADTAAALAAMQGCGNAR